MTIKKKLSAKQRRNLYNFLEILPDKAVLHLQYYATVGRKLNLKNPKRFTEKLQWYKVNYRNPKMTICADKYRIREYIRSYSYQENLPELYGVYDSFDEIEFKNLPNKFVIKCNNGSGTNIFIEDKQLMSLEEVEKIVRSWNKVNTLTIGREWVYKNIEQKIIIEELLLPTDKFQIDNGLNDYKFLCFNGKAEYIVADISRESNHRRNIYDLEWNQIDVITDKPLFKSKLTKPENLEEMLEIANTFSKDFPFVRVDFYNLNGKVYIGELTFYPWSGCVQFTPDEFDYELGKLFILPETRNKRSGECNNVE